MSGVHRATPPGPPPAGDKATAPFSPVQVDNLNAYQASNAFHPFTCGNDDCPGTDGEQAALVAAADGWHCPACTYRQFWAHEMMADGSRRGISVRVGAEIIKGTIESGPPAQAAATPGQAAYASVSDRTTHGDDIDLITQMRYERDQAIGVNENLRGQLDKALAANQRWAAALGDVQQRHAEVKRQRDDAREAAAEMLAYIEADDNCAPSITLPVTLASWRARLDGAATATAPAGPAPELAAAMAETRAVRDGYARLCGEFGPSAQSGWSARIPLARLNQHRGRAGLEAFSRTESGQREDITMRYRRERDEAREQLAVQHEAMTQLRAGHSEALAEADRQVSAALATVSRWQDENQRLIAERDELQALIDAGQPALATELLSAREERDKLSDACQLLARTLSMYVRSLYATWIDAAQHRDLKAVIEALGESLDGFDGPEWNGSETGTEWLERTRGEDVVSEALGEGDGDAAETASILADPETMAAVAEGERDA